MAATYSHKFSLKMLHTKLLNSPIVASREYRQFDDDNLKQLRSVRLMMQP